MVNSRTFISSGVRTFTLAPGQTACDHFPFSSWTMVAPTWMARKHRRHCVLYLACVRTMKLLNVIPLFWNPTPLTFLITKFRLQILSQLVRDETGNAVQRILGGIRPAPDKFVAALRRAERQVVR